MTTRRQFLQTGLFAATAVSFPGQRLFAQTAKKAAISLAVQTYTLRQFDFEEGIKKTREAGIDEVEIAGGNTFWGGERKRSVALNAEERRRLRSVLDENGVRAISLGGSPGTPEDFDFAKEMGLQFLQGEPPVEKLVEVSRRAEEYNIRFSLHNHAKPTKYWDYQETLKRVQDCSPALGICPDTGHFIRSGFDPLEVIRAFKGRMVSVHLKDLDGTDQEATPKPKDVAWGSGKGQVEAVLKELMAQEFTGPVIIEYDHIYPDGNVEDVKKCAEFFWKIVGRK
ncbi:MAG: sugar phosphate isomerase/epimerase [Planctomycetaceae bacterium]|nr:sugar phosphate isomerase/epimerase [Planctomycetaceae bacterium]